MRAWMLTACLLWTACKREDDTPVEKLPLPDRGSDRIAIPPPPPPPPPRPRPQPPTGGVVGGPIGGSPDAVPPSAFEGQRVAGDKTIEPDAATAAEIQRTGKVRVVVPVKVCLDELGAVKSTTILKSSGFPAYDAKLTSTIEATWKFRPFEIGGVATAVCTAVTFVHAVR